MTSDPSRLEQIVTFLQEDRRVVHDLVEEDRRLAAIGCLLALHPAGAELRDEVRGALDAGMNPRLIEAMIIHAVGYLGVIRLKPAVETLLATVPAGALAAESFVSGDRRTRINAGAELYDRFDPGRQAKQSKMFEALSPAYYPAAMELAGLTLGPPELALRERQIMTIAILSCLGGQDAQLRFHIGVAHRNGVARETVASILILVQAYAGMPRANSAAGLALKALTA